MICSGSHSWEVTTRTKCWALGANPLQPIDLTQSKFQTAFLTRQWADTWAEPAEHSQYGKRTPPTPVSRSAEAAVGRLSDIPAIIYWLLSSPSSPVFSSTTPPPLFPAFSPPLFLVKLNDQDEDLVRGPAGPEIGTFVDS